MEQSIPNFAKEAFQNLKTSLFQGASNRRYYAQMDQESENEEEENMSHSLFYSVHQQKHNINEDSIPLTLSNAYSDRSQLLFEQSEHEDYDQHDISFHHSQESPTPPVKKENKSLVLLSYFINSFFLETFNYIP